LKAYGAPCRQFPVSRVCGGKPLATCPPSSRAAGALVVTAADAGAVSGC